MEHNPDRIAIWPGYFDQKLSRRSGRRVAKDASALYGKNIVNFLTLMVNKDQKEINIDWEDEIINEVVLSHDGKIKLERFQ